MASATRRNAITLLARYERVVVLSCGASVLRQKVVMLTASGEASRWTAERVSEMVIEAFRLLPTMPVYAPRRGGLAAVFSGQDIGPLEILSFSETVLGYNAPERRALLVWARAKATGGDVGGSIRHYCMQHGVSQNTFNRRHKRACRMIADALSGADEGKSGQPAPSDSVCELVD